MSEGFFQGMLKGFEELSAKFSRGGARAVDADTLKGLETQREKRTQFKAELEQSPPKGLVRDDPRRPEDTRHNPTYDPPGLRGPGGERRQG